jgi:hypothetical protein
LSSTTSRNEDRWPSIRLARAVALADDVPELTSELARRSARIQHLKAQIAASRKTPDEMSSLMATVEANCREHLRDLHAALADRGDLRHIFLALFPDGLTLTPEWVPAEPAPRRRHHFGHPTSTDQIA